MSDWSPPANLHLATEIEQYAAPFEEPWRCWVFPTPERLGEVFGVWCPRAWEDMDHSRPTWGPAWDRWEKAISRELLHADIIYGGRGPADSFVSMLWQPGVCDPADRPGPVAMDASITLIAKAI